MKVYRTLYGLHLLGVTPHFNFKKKKKKKKKKLYPKKQYLHHHRVNSKDWFDAIKSTLSEIYRINKYP